MALDKLPRLLNGINNSNIYSIGLSLRLNELVNTCKFDYSLGSSKYYISMLNRISILSKFKFRHFTRLIDEETEINMSSNLIKGT